MARGSSRRPRARAPFAALGLLAGLALACGSAPGPAPGERPRGIVLIGVDTLRADGLSLYGNPRPTSPTLDALARDGVWFENTISNAAWTLPGFVGILTGDYYSHRIYRGRKLLHSGVETLRAAGYTTAAFVEGGYMSREFGFDLGFDSFWEETAPVYVEPTPDTGVARTFGLARSWLREHADRPFFLFLHTYEVHVPYHRLDFAAGLPHGVLHETYPLRDNLAVLGLKLHVTGIERDYVRALYAGGVLAVDREVASLLDLLRELGVADHTLVAVTSDHGEALGERHLFELGRHGHALYDTLVRVPLILHGPGIERADPRIRPQVRTIDIMPTLLDCAGVAAPSWMRGHSLMPLVRGEEKRGRLAYSELTSQTTGALERAAVRTRKYKLILNVRDDEGSGTLELYDLRADPQETHNLVDELPDVRNDLQFRLYDERKALDAVGRPRAGRDDGVSDELRERLRALGYAQ